MGTEQKSMTAMEARELLAKGWELTQRSMDLIGLPVPHYIHFQIEGTKQIRATRVAELDELAKAIGALDTDIGRLVQGMPALVSYDSDIERLGREKAALAELQKRAGRNGCPGSTTVIEALFPDVPVKKKTASEKAEIEKWLAIRKEAGLKIDPETAEVDWDYGNDFDPYGVWDEWEVPQEFEVVGRQRLGACSGKRCLGSFQRFARHRQRRVVGEASLADCFPRGLIPTALNIDLCPFPGRD